MKKKDIIEGKIIKTEFPNKGTFICEDQKVTVKGVIDGQTIKGQVTKKRKSGCVVRLLDVLEKSPLEDAKPVCPHFGICGGCFYQTVSYENQLKIKEGMVRDLLKDYVNDDIWEEIKGSPKVHGYRNKMEFSFGDEVKDGPLALGMHKKNTFHDIVNITDCQIVDNDYNLIVKCALNIAQQMELPFYHKMRHEGYFRHLVVRRAESSGDILVNIVTTSQVEADLTKLRDTLLELPLSGKIIGILHTTNDSLADVVQADKIDILYGQDYFYEEILGLKFKISPFSFFQTNTLGAEILYKTARDFVGETKDKVIFDLYSGTGTIAQMLAPVAKKVVGVEIVEEAVEAAKVNAELNGLDNCEFIAGDVLKVVDELEDKPDFIVLDPPRDGIHPKAIQKIIDFGVEQMVYISCKPTSLARDLEVFEAAGYKVKRATAVDQFPNTVHIETVVLLSQQKPDDTIEIDLDLDELDATSAELKATYQEIKDYVLKEFGLKVSSLYISQVKRKCGIEVGENYNLPKSENARVPQCPNEKEDAIKAALKYYAMI
ncbi:23S rRNA (uracil(1939)-C(5))-methyltransferase RlmD [Anaerostipes hadrus]|uniref:23S rRNA (uracil(1939)-C(5))-methyltransferase RlmD n=1 Tax=Anaerostipes hadrus TaxID=649756 RepID=UPI0005D145F9|nr:23S rRNA (uracil(1939)-C(5))-methyltransferase RlmD [Anaerostipes hadrus]